MESLDIARVADGVSRREYSLLLGAGASIGSLGGNNEPLPSGPQLQDKLLSEFSIELQGQTIRLPRVFAAARRKDSRALEDYIRLHFTGCKPDWQYILADMDWHRIWTLNIDDIIETVHEKRRLQFDRFNWTSKFRDGSNSERQIIHLHGYAKDINDTDATDSDLVFSIQEYAATIRDPRAWHAVFTDEFAERPFIVLGASLMEEFDLQEALSSSAATQTRGFPSVIVLKEVTELEREEFSELGLIVVESDARAFMTSLNDEVRKHRAKLGGMYGQTYDPILARFLQQFIDLRQYDPTPNENTRQFYSGYEPHWRNILDEDDASIDSTTKTLSTIRDTQKQDDTKQAIHVLTGTPGTGKSTGLLRIGRAFVAEGLPTFLFRGDERLDTAATIRWLQRIPTTVL